MKNEYKKIYETVRNLQDYIENPAMHKPIEIGIKNLLNLESEIESFNELRKEIIQLVKEDKPFYYEEIYIKLIEFSSSQKEIFNYHENYIEECFAKKILKLFKEFKVDNSNIIFENARVKSSLEFISKLIEFFLKNKNQHNFLVVYKNIKIIVQEEAHNNFSNDFLSILKFWIKLFKIDKKSPIDLFEAQIKRELVNRDFKFHQSSTNIEKMTLFLNLFNEILKKLIQDKIPLVLFKYQDPKTIEDLEIVEKAKWLSRLNEFVLRSINPSNINKLYSCICRFLKSNFEDPIYQKYKTELFNLMNHEDFVNLFSQKEESHIEYEEIPDEKREIKQENIEYNNSDFPEVEELSDHSEEEKHEEINLNEEEPEIAYGLQLIEREQKKQSHLELSEVQNINFKDEKKKNKLSKKLRLLNREKLQLEEEKSKLFEKMNALKLQHQQELSTRDEKSEQLEKEVQDFKEEIQNLKNNMKNIENEKFKLEKEYSDLERYYNDLKVDNEILLKEKDDKIDYLNQDLTKGALYMKNEVEYFKKRNKDLTDEVKILIKKNKKLTEKSKKDQREYSQEIMKLKKDKAILSNDVSKYNQQIQEKDKEEKLYLNPYVESSAKYRQDEIKTYQYGIKNLKEELESQKIALETSKRNNEMEKNIIREHYSTEMFKMQSRSDNLAYYYKTHAKPLKDLPNVSEILDEKKEENNSSISKNFENMRKKLRKAIEEDNNDYDVLEELDLIKSLREVNNNHKENENIDQEEILDEKYEPIQPLFHHTQIIPEKDVFKKADDNQKNLYQKARSFCDQIEFETTIEGKISLLDSSEECLRDLKSQGINKEEQRDFYNAFVKLKFSIHKQKESLKEEIKQQNKFGFFKKDMIKKFEKLSQRIDDLFNDYVIDPIGNIFLNNNN